MFLSYFLNMIQLCHQLYIELELIEVDYVWISNPNVPMLTLETDLDALRVNVIHVV